MTYWEKTVEYAFLALAIREKAVDFAAPLSGKLERGAGDAIFAQDSRYILLEFKMNESGVADEKDKFDDYDKAKKALDTKDRHHFFVYGCGTSESLELVSRTYFSGPKPKDDSGSALDCFANGADKDTFDKYLDQFLSYRRRDERGGRGGGGDVDISNYATVIGVAPGSNSAIACSLRDYAGHFAPNHVLSPATEPPPPASPKRR